MADGLEGAPPGGEALTRRAARLAGAAVVGLILAAPVLRAQGPARPYLAWKSVETPHFTINYPPELEAWARDVASRMESVDSAVSRLVGFSPEYRVQIVVDDPYGLSNGSALPLRRNPVITFWASPPSPRLEIGDFRTWGEMLAVHEFAHVAHLTRPSRNPFTRTLWSILPVDVTPIVRKAPRWAIEGYATFIEGRITGSGRPNNAWRAAILRQWAIEGRLPSYAELNSSSSFNGGSFAYLVGSAYLDWLAHRRGDASPVHVWRRLTAREKRSFDEAFAGVYGDSPGYLYGKFTAELTARAMEAARLLGTAGRDTGEMVQHLAWATGSPAISPDGKLVALVLRGRAAPSRLVVLNTTPEPDSVVQKREAELVMLDPDDVPPIHIYPRPRTPLATLLPRGGRSFEDPRFLPDGRRLLVWHHTVQYDGTIRPDLYIWDTRDGNLQRVTHNGSIREADPSPDGRTAVATRCMGGTCDLVSVDLTTGAITTIVEGSLTRSFYRPRWSRDARSIAVSMQDAGRWHLALVDMQARTLRVVDSGEDVNRFDVAFRSPTEVVLSSDRGGITNLQLVDLGTGAARPLTRVTGAAIGAEPNPVDGSIWFLSLHARGYDLRRLPSAASSLDSVVTLPARLAPAVRVREDTGLTLSVNPTAPPHGYGLGPRVTRWLPAPNAGPDGASATLAITSSDVIGRLDVLLQGVAGDPAMWRGGAFAATWRGWRPEVKLQAFVARQEPSQTHAFNVAPDSLDIDLRGGAITVSHAMYGDTWTQRLEIGGSYATLGPDRDGDRTLGFARLSGGYAQTGDRWKISESLSVQGDAGRTAGAEYQRVVGTFGLTTGGERLPAFSGTATAGVSAAGTPAFELFNVGGLQSPLLGDALLSQRYSVPALPTGTAMGDRLLAFRVATNIGAFEPFYLGASTRNGPGDFNRWNRVFGVELNFRWSSIPMLSAPSGRAVVGVARSMDAPFANTTRGYLSMVLGR